MFQYRVKYTESEYDIQNNDSLYKIDPKHQNAFEFLKTFGTILKKTKHENLFNFIISINSIIHIL